MFSCGSHSSVAPAARNSCVCDDTRRVAAIELGRRRRGDQRMRARVHLHVDAQLVAAHHAARRMHEIDMAGIAFGIERPLDHERARDDWRSTSRVRAVRRSGTLC